MLLRVSDVLKRYGDTVALDGVSLGADSGEICTVLGRNGAGKTTLASAIAGLIRVDRGRIEIDGLNPHRHSPDTLRTVGVAAQDIALYPILTVQENLEFFARYYGVPRADCLSRVSQVASTLLIEDLLSRRVRFLSGGEKRRVHVAAAIIHRPSLVILDEPTAGVDIETREAVLTCVRELAQQGACILYSTHYFSEVEALNCRVVILDKGSVVADAQLHDLVADYGRQEVRVTTTSDLLGDSQFSDSLATTIQLETESTSKAIEGVLARLDRHETISNIEILRPNLENVFFALIGARPEMGPIEAIEGQNDQ